MKNLLHLLLLTAALTTFACGGDDDGPIGPNCTAERFSNDVQAAVNNLSTAASNYANDQSAGNCTAYKNSASAYLDAVMQYDDCAGVNRTEFNQQLDAARDAVAAITC